MVEADGKLSERDERLALLIAGGATRQRAATEVGCAVRTVYNRMQSPAFVARVRELRGEMVGESVGLLARLATDAVATLGALLKADNDGVRLNATTAILGHLTKLREHEELQGRIERIEATLASVPDDAQGERWG